MAVRIIPGELKTVQAENPMLFTKGVAVVQKRDFSDIITPGRSYYTDEINIKRHSRL